MRFSYILRMSLKNLRRYKLRAALTAGGVAIAIGFIAFLVSLGYGLEKVSTGQLSSMEALQILDVSAGNSKVVKLNSESLEKIYNLQEVSTILPEASVAGEFTLKESKADGIVYGKKLESLVIQKPRLVSGSYFSNTEGKDETLVSMSLVKKLGFKDAKDILDQKISQKVIIRPELMGNPKGSAKVETLEFYVSGVLEDDGSSYAYIPLEKLESLGVSSYSSLKIKTKNKEGVQKVKTILEQMGFKTSTLKDTMEEVSRFFNIFKTVLLLFGLVSVIVSCVGMFNTLTISLIEKTREIGMMKSLGATKKDVRRIFICEALMLGALGGIIGVLFSFFLGKILNAFIYSLARSTGNAPVKLFIFPLGLVAMSLVLSVVISFLTGAYPSRRASRISALDALRYE